MISRSKKFILLFSQLFLYTVMFSYTVYARECSTDPVTTMAITYGIYAKNNLLNCSAVVLSKDVCVSPAAKEALAQQNSMHSFGSLTMNGTVTVDGNTMTLALPTAISDMTIVAPVVIKAPTSSGSVVITVNGSAYTDPIPGLTITLDQALNTFEIDGDVSVTAAAAGVYTNIAAGNTLNINGALTCNGQDQGFIVINGTVTATGDITMNNNSGVGIGGTVTATGNITMSNNSGAFGVDVGGTVTATGDITMNNNSGVGGVPCVGIGGTVTATGDITMSNNNSGGGPGVLIGGTVTATGDITMNNNSGVGGPGVLIGGTVTATGDITMNNNSCVFGGPGVSIISGTVQTDGIFTIIIADSPLQAFNSNAVTITRRDGTTAVLYSSFAVTVGGTACPTYGSIPNDRVFLASANQII